MSNIQLFHITTKLLFFLGAMIDVGGSLWVTSAVEVLINSRYDSSLLSIIAMRQGYRVLNQISRWIKKSNSETKKYKLLLLLLLWNNCAYQLWKYMSAPCSNCNQPNTWRWHQMQVITLSMKWVQWSQKWKTPRRANSYCCCSGTKMSDCSKLDQKRPTGPT